MYWKEYFAEHHNSKAALKSPPHITLHMPFKWRTQNEEQIIKLLEKVTSEHQSFTIGLSGFSAFAPRVIFIDMKENIELRKLQVDLVTDTRKELKIFNDNYKERGFHPHMTVAFRDLKKPEFFKAWKKFENEEFSGEFVVAHLCLLKHNGSTWDVYKRFHLNN